VKTAEEFERAFGHAAPDALANTLRSRSGATRRSSSGEQIPEIALPPGSPPTEAAEMATAGSSAARERARRKGLPQALAEEYRRRLAYDSPSSRRRVRQLLLIVADFIAAKDNGFRWAGPRQAAGAWSRTGPDHRGGSDPVQAPFRTS